MRNLVIFVVSAPLAGSVLRDRCSPNLLGIWLPLGCVHAFVECLGLHFVVHWRTDRHGACVKRLEAELVAARLTRKQLQCSNGSL